MRWSICAIGAVPGALALVLASATQAEDEDQSVGETPHFLKTSEYMAMTPEERRAFVMGVFDGFLYGLEAGKAGWTLEWVDRCTETLTSGQLRDGADKDAENSASFTIDGESLADKFSAATTVYSALVNICDPQQPQSTGTTGTSAGRPASGSP